MQRRPTLVQGLSNWPATNEDQTVVMELGGTHEILCQGTASLGDMGSESDMNFIVSTVLGNHGGGVGGGVRYGGWLIGVKSVWRDLA